MIGKKLWQVALIIAGILQGLMIVLISALATVIVLKKTKDYRKFGIIFILFSVPASILLGFVFGRLNKLLINKAEFNSKKSSPDIDSRNKR